MTPPKVSDKRLSFPALHFKIAIQFISTPLTYLSLGFPTVPFPIILFFIILFSMRLSAIH
jgi:hypothetical protein